VRFRKALGDALKLNTCQFRQYRRVSYSSFIPLISFRTQRAWVHWKWKHCTTWRLTVRFPNPRRKSTSSPGANGPKLWFFIGFSGTSFYTLPCPRSPARQNEWIWHVVVGAIHVSDSDWPKSRRPIVLARADEYYIMRLAPQKWMVWACLVVFLHLPISHFPEKRGLETTGIGTSEPVSHACVIDRQLGIRGPAFFFFVCVYSEQLLYPAQAREGVLRPLHRGRTELYKPRCGVSVTL